MTNASMANWYPPAGDERPRSLDEVLAAVRLLLPMLDAIPNAVVFMKDAQARYVMANQTLAQRCGHRSAQPLLGRTSAEIFPAQMGPGYTRQDRRVLEEGLVLKDQLELHLFGSREPGWCLTYKQPIRDREDRIIGLAGCSVDLRSAGSTHPAYQRLAAVEDHIRNRFGGPVPMHEMTRVAGMSTAQLERHFKRVFHLTPRQMIQKYRLEHAHRLLRQGLPVTQVAVQCGYADHSAFTRQFKAMTGFTPRQYQGMDADRR